MMETDPTTFWIVTAVLIVCNIVGIIRVFQTSKMGMPRPSDEE